MENFQDLHQYDNKILQVVDMHPIKVHVTIEVARKGLGGGSQLRLKLHKSSQGALYGVLLCSQLENRGLLSLELVLPKFCPNNNALIGMISPCKIILGKNYGLPNLGNN